MNSHRSKSTNIKINEAHNYVYDKLNLDFNFIFGELKIENLEKSDINYLICIFYFWKDRINKENVSINQNIMNNYSVHNIEIIRKKVYSLGLEKTFNRLISNNFDPLDKFYKKFKTTRYIHIMKISKALELYKKAKSIKESFKICNKENSKFLKNYNISLELIPEPTIYLSKQNKYRMSFNEVIKNKKKIINMICFHRISKAIINYYDFMHFNFDKNYGLEFINCINSSTFIPKYYQINKFKRLKIDHK